MNERKLISIITIVYNGEETIEKTIKSVLQQTHSNIEYIIIDGSSTDGTVDIIKSFGDQITHWISEKDDGIYDAMNKGLKFATGDIIGIINADDFYEIDALEKVAESYETGMVIYHGHLRNIEERGSSFINVAPNDLKKLKRGMIINHPATFVNKEVYTKLGGFCSNYRIAGDWDFILKCYINKVSFIRVNYVLANFALGGVSGAISDKYLEEMSLIRKKRGLYKNFDKYFLYDKIRFKLLGKYLYKLYLLKKRVFNA